MTNGILVLCDERDIKIGAALRAELVLGGGESELHACDAGSEGLDAQALEHVALARTVVVIVREGGRGNRLLRAAEDKAREPGSVLPLIADTSESGVSARTQARIEALVATLVPRSPDKGPRSPAPSAPRPRRRGKILVALGGLLVVATVLIALLLPKGPSGAPVVLTGMLSNSGWIISFHLREEASVLEYKLPRDADFIATGDSGPGFGPDRDKPRARLWVVVDDLHGKVPILVRYRTTSGSASGPYEVVFDTEAQAVASAKKILSEIAPRWISFGQNGDRKLCYFTTVLSYKYALRSIEYGLDAAPPDKSIRFVPRAKGEIDPGDDIYVEVPSSTSSVTVALTYLDGTRVERRLPAGD